MKKMDMFCASQASTAICMSMDEPSSSSAVHLGGRSIDRHNPIIRDQRRTPRALPLAPCTSQPPPINPQPYHLLHKKKKKNAKKQNDVVSKGKKSSSKMTSSSSSSSSSSGVKDDCITVDKDVVVERKSWAQPGDNLITPAGSSRYLLSDVLQDYDPVTAMLPVESQRFFLAQAASSPSQSQRFLARPSSNHHDPTSSKPSPVSDSAEKPSNQEVVLRVSLHCRGCEGKVRKHLSRMEGVRWYNIDFAAKKVTIVGDVTPLGVLASVSKVKSAQFWAPTASPAAVNSQLKK